LIPTIDLITVSDIWSTTIQDRLLYHKRLPRDKHSSLHKHFEKFYDVKTCFPQVMFETVMTSLPVGSIGQLPVSGSTVAFPQSTKVALASTSPSKKFRVSFDILSPTFRRFFTDFSPIFHRFFTDFFFEMEFHSIIVEEKLLKINQKKIFHSNLHFLAVSVLAPQHSIQQHSAK
jgi:hypothetical protein